MAGQLRNSPAFCLTKEYHPMTKKAIILIDNGHGVNTAGKCSPDALQGLKDSPFYFKEWKWTRKCARGIVSSLRVRGYDARLLVPEDSDISLTERVRRANAVCDEHGKDNVLLVSVHVNASPGSGEQWKTARGWSAYTTKGVTQADTLAAELIDAADEVFKSPLKVRKYSNADRLSRDFEENFSIVQKTLCPAVLTENFFQDNKEDVMYLKSEAGLRGCVDVHVRGIVNYIVSKKS